MYARRVSLGLLVLFGCAYQPTPNSDSFGPVKGPSADLVKQLEKQAQFELDCSKDALTYTRLGPRMVGVEGCDQKRAYRYVSDFGWTDSDDATPAISR